MPLCIRICSAICHGLACPHLSWSRISRVVGGGPGIHMCMTICPMSRLWIDASSTIVSASWARTCWVHDIPLTFAENRNDLSEILNNAHCESVHLYTSSGIAYIYPRISLWIMWALTHHSNLCPNLPYDKSLNYYLIMLSIPLRSVLWSHSTWNNLFIERTF